MDLTSVNLLKKFVCFNDKRRGVRIDIMLDVDMYNIGKICTTSCPGQGKGLESMQRITTLFGGNNGDEEEDFLHEFDGSCSLSPLQRIYGFAACLVGGLACMFLSLIVFAKPIKFALLFTFGNLLAVGSSAFLIGPTHQFQMMLDSVRVYATVIYIGSVIVALFCALLVHSKLLTILAMIVEICALVWYGLSYIPFARRMVRELFISFGDTEI